MSTGGSSAAPPAASGDASPPRARGALVALLAGLALASLGFVALGVWQVQRLHWKLDLIERVDTRVHATPAAPPPPAQWGTVTRARDEYRHVTVDGTWLGGRDTRVKAVTDFGEGWWLLRPLRLADGSVVLVNRGFVPDTWRANDDADPQQAGHRGPLRISEPGGGFLRDNAPADNRWYSRDVQAIATSRGLGRVAPYFIDADAARSARTNSSRWPRGGLTVVRFRNSHLSYALTWFALALMAAGAGWYVVRDAQRRRRRVTGSAPPLAAGDTDRQPR